MQTLSPIEFKLTLDDDKNKMVLVLWKNDKITPQQPVVIKIFYPRYSTVRLVRDVFTFGSCHIKFGIQECKLSMGGKVESVGSVCWLWETYNGRTS